MQLQIINDGFLNNMSTPVLKKTNNYKKKLRPSGLDDITSKHRPHSN